MNGFKELISWSIKLFDLCFYLKNSLEDQVERKSNSVKGFLIREQGNSPTKTLDST